MTTKANRVLDYDDKPVALGTAQVRVDDEDDRVSVHANGIVVDVIANDDGSVYVEMYAYDGRTKQAVVGSSFLDAYTTRSPNLRLSLADRPHPAVRLLGGDIPAHQPGSYPSLSCCGGPKRLTDLDLA